MAVQLAYQKKVKLVMQDLGEKQDLNLVLTCLKWNWKTAIIQFINNAVTYVIYPNYCFKLNIGTQEKWMYPLVILIFSLMDFCGKTLNSKIQIKEGIVFYCVGILRIGFLVFFLLPVYVTGNAVMGSVWYGVGMIVLCGFSNGIIVSACFSIPAEVGPQEIRKVSSYLMLTAMFLGITFGSFWPIILLN